MHPGGGLLVEAAKPAPEAAAPVRLHGRIGAVQYFALGFGTMIGSAWIVLLSSWLTTSGPGGAVLGFACGGVVMMLVGRAYAELISRAPEAGSEFIYAYRLIGPRAGFVVGWFLLLYLIGVTVYEALALPRVIETLFPQTESLTLYSIFGAPITAEALGVSLAVLALLLGLNLRGVKSAVQFHSLLTYGFLVVALCVVGLMLAFGRVDNALPLFASTTGRPWWEGAWATFAFSAAGLTGFQAIPQTIEERAKDVPLATVQKVVVLSIGAAAFFYSLVIVACSLAAPWKASSQAALAPAAAALHIPGGRYVAVVLLCATAMSLLKAWNGVFMMAVRLMLAMARVGLLPPALARLDERFQSPRAAVLAVAALNFVGLLLGRGAFLPVVNMCTMVLTCIYVLCCGLVLVLRSRAQGRAAWRGVGPLLALATGSVLVMALVALISPFWRGEPGLPLEWRLLLAWAFAGLVFWFAYARPRWHADRTPLS